VRIVVAANFRSWGPLEFSEKNYVFLLGNYRTINKLHPVMGSGVLPLHLNSCFSTLRKKRISGLSVASAKRTRGPIEVGENS
jgi:hypothetical protein